VKFIEINSKNIYQIIFWLSYILIVCTYSVLFSHSDLNHTVMSSYAILNGHITDFYEFNKIEMGGNDYLPFIYWVFAIWNSPFCLFSDCNPVASFTFSQLFLQKSFLAILFLVSVKIINLIAKEISESNAPNVTMFYATSTVMIFCVFAFNQYDIVGMVFSLYGILLYLRNKVFKFAAMFSLAISIKYFAVIAFFPFLLVHEKRLTRLIGYSLVATSAIIIQIFVYIDSQQFMTSFFSLALKKGYGNNSLNELGSMVFLVIGYGIILITCWLIKPKNISDKFKICILASIVAYLMVYLKVDWHPQWICIVIPYLAFSMLYSNLKKINVLFQLIFGVTYLLLVVSRYPNNLDNLMLGSGFFRDYFGNSHIAIVSIYKFINFKFVAYAFYLSIIYFVCVAVFSKKEIPAKINYPLQTVVIWLANLTFLLPALFIAFSNPTELSKFDSSADLRNKNIIKIINGNFNGKYLEINGRGSTLDIFFKPEKPNLSAISLIFGTHHKVVDSVIVLKIFNDAENIYHTKLDFTKINYNMLTTLKNIDAGNRCDDGCHISLEVISGDSPLEIWYETNKIQPNSVSFNSEDLKVDGTFVIEAFYKR
jgi:hypothetical protein